jgi:branched-subunit amino acid aminotransferase/4-amino-4-deoxychorismate lyase
MTRNDIINLARQHGKPVQEQNAEVEYLFTLEGVNALLAAEREACAKVCDAHTVDDVLVGVGIGQSCAAAIRARGNP